MNCRGTEEGVNGRKRTQWSVAQWKGETRRFGCKFVREAAHSRRSVIRADWTEIGTHIDRKQPDGHIAVVVTGKPFSANRKSEWNCCRVKFSGGHKRKLGTDWITAAVRIEWVVKVGDKQFSPLPTHLPHSTCICSANCFPKKVNPKCPPSVVAIINNNNNISNNNCSGISCSSVRSWRYWTIKNIFNWIWCGSSGQKMCY